MKKSDDGDDGQRRRCKQEKKRQYVSNNWSYLLKVLLLEETPAVLSWGTSVRIMEYHTTDQRSKTTSHQKWQDN